MLPTLCTLYSVAHHGTHSLGAKSNRRRETSNKGVSLFYCTAISVVHFVRFVSCVRLLCVNPLLIVAAATGQKVAIPTVSEAGVVSKWSELDGGGGSKAIDRVKNRDYDGSLYMVNKPPRWNDQVVSLLMVTSAPMCARPGL